MRGPLLVSSPQTARWEVLGSSFCPPPSWLLSLHWGFLPVFWVPPLTFPDVCRGDLGWKLLSILDVGS